ncbi:MAG: hypothetical protein KJ002_06680 [Candidatus Dadabacteria bacterium]|nr:hypothetical protein [Candidatus Dadabacteria bacterium]
MTKIKMLKLILLGFFIALPVGCATIEPGSIDDPGQAVGAPTEPSEISEGMEEGDDYPEEYE